ncbi:alkaline phosphatase [Thalassomonas actiniarum]|uniref:Alkaline phosphatase n=1 Tax=Thalassomonas actiniarum TaxID=485447 RepID=A0AAE9YXD9_9GAMM|nr:alkaline phosphatase [Thalassomonas actiniarum]WDE01337.1 alkaline phosphatase [Thalassomonas actiniarum]
MKRVLSTLFLCMSSISYAKTTAPENIIMIVADGMGPAYTSAYRYFQDDPNTQAIEETVFDRHLVGMSSTYPARVSGYVTDSAAGATALATGIKTYNGAIGVDVDKKPLESVLVWAKKQGKQTGVVVTSRINHATPASYLSHNESRRNYDAIADSYVDSKLNGQFKADLMLGGGWKHFIRDDRNLVNEFKQAGFHYLDSYDELSDLPKNQPVLGLFANGGLPWALDDSNKHRLSVMAKAATKQLENKNGYFMLVEASQVDWGGHRNDIAVAMAEMDDLAKTLEFLEGYVAKNPDTLVVLTADHSTGGFTIGAHGEYAWRPDVLRTMIMSPETIAEKLSQKDISKSLTKKLFNFALTDVELAQLQLDKANAEAEIKAYETAKAAGKEKKLSEPKEVASVLETSIKHLIDQRTNTGWTSGGHTGIDVPVFAFGQQSELFNGLQDNTDIAKKIFGLLGKK